MRNETYMTTRQASHTANTLTINAKLYDPLVS